MQSGKKLIYLELESTGNIFFQSLLYIYCSLNSMLNVFILLRRRPSVLRKRKQVSSEEDLNVKPIEINTEATGIELHKDSKYLFRKILALCCDNQKIIYFVDFTKVGKTSKIKILMLTKFLIGRINMKRVIMQSFELPDYSQKKL
jgi:hypothetical protein